MQLVEVENRSEDLVQQLVAVWERSVRATHSFLSKEEIAQIKEYAPPGYRLGWASAGCPDALYAFVYLLIAAQ